MTYTDKEVKEAVVIGVFVTVALAAIVGAFTYEAGKANGENGVKEKEEARSRRLNKQFESDVEEIYAKKYVTVAADAEKAAYTKLETDYNERFHSMFYACDCEAAAMEQCWFDARDGAYYTGSGRDEKKKRFPIDVARPVECLEGETLWAHCQGQGIAMCLPTVEKPKEKP
jgi:hypothetical protein